MGQDEGRDDDSGNDDNRATAYLRHDDNSGFRLTPLTPLMPNESPRSTKIVERGYCPDTIYEEKLQEK